MVFVAIVPPPSRFRWRPVCGGFECRPVLPASLFPAAVRAAFPSAAVTPPPCLPPFFLTTVECSPPPPTFLPWLLEYPTPARCFWGYPPSVPPPVKAIPFLLRLLLPPPPFATQPKMNHTTDGVRCAKVQAKQRQGVQLERSGFSLFFFFWEWWKVSE